LYVANAAGGPASALTTGGGNDSYAQWAANGEDVYFVSHRDDRHGVYRIRLDRNLQCRRATR
jgi:Tol biopolymer transport system component